MPTENSIIVYITTDAGKFYRIFPDMRAAKRWVRRIEKDDSKYGEVYSTWFHLYEKEVN